MTAECPSRVPRITSPFSLCPFSTIHCSSLAPSGQHCCQSDWWAAPSAVRSEQDHQAKIMQSEILAERSWQVMDLPAAPAGFKGILSRQGKRFRGSGEAPVHHLLQDTNDGGGSGGVWVLYYQPGEETKPIWFRPNRIVPKMSQMIQDKKWK